MDASFHRGQPLTSENKSPLVNGYSAPPALPSPEANHGEKMRPNRIANAAPSELRLLPFSFSLLPSV
jgi:hypothetical protein